jgi:predicted DCC family thiol-disulfide oxidoreductase YuxK
VVRRIGIIVPKAGGMADASDCPYFVFYDGHCQLCARSRQRIERLRHDATVTFVNSRDERAMAAFPMVDREAARAQMFVLTPTGQLAGGYDAFVALLPALPTFRWLRPALGLAPVAAVGRRVYRLIARNRYRLWGSVPCADGACRIHTP